MNNTKHRCQSPKLICQQDFYRHNNSSRSEEHTSELQSLRHLGCPLLLEKKKSASLLLYARNLSPSFGAPTPSTSFASNILTFMNARSAHNPWHSSRSL